MIASRRALGLAAATALWLARDPGSAEIEAGITELRSIGAQLFTLDASSIVRRGSGRVIAVRLGADVELVPHHFSSANLPGPMTVEAWAKER